MRFDILPPVMNVGAGADNTSTTTTASPPRSIGYTGAFTHDLTKPVGMKRKLMDVSLAKSWGWTARTALKDGIAKTYAFYLQDGAARAA